jgi:cystathionine beta-synthase
MPNWDVNRTYAKSILNTIGSTPLVRLNRVTGGIKPEILVKLEYFSPSGSLKDRIYLNMIEKAERRGALKKGMTILECSTGNAGIACSSSPPLEDTLASLSCPKG